MSPLIYKKLLAKWACDKLKEDINLSLSRNTKADQTLVNNAMKDVLEHVHSKSPSAVWGKRKRLMTTLSDWLKEDAITSPNQLTEKLTAILKSHYLIDALDQNDKDFSIQQAIIHN